MSDVISESSGVWGDLLGSSEPLTSLSGDGPIASCVANGAGGYSHPGWRWFLGACGALVLAQELWVWSMDEPSLFVLLVAAALFSPLLRRLLPAVIETVLRPQLTAFSDRIEVSYGSWVRSIPWSEIECLRLPQFYNDIPVDANFQAVARPFGWQVGAWQLPLRRSIKVHARFHGDAEGVIRTMMTHCDYIVQEPDGFAGTLKRSTRQADTGRGASK